MTDCPLCSNQMLRHVRLQQTYWFCRHCWQEMPNLMLEENKSFVALSVTLTSAFKDKFNQLQDVKLAANSAKILLR